ncbi:hypothetical protein, partial [Sediminimonas qiaohouensis]|uniref:hypothetical protein n=1 Tax=Sediminimonas qiaohouensis TaxID=552061 RepID=UPI002356E738
CNQPGKLPRDPSPAAFQASNRTSVPPVKGYLLLQNKTRNPFFAVMSFFLHQTRNSRVYNLLEKPRFNMPHATCKIIAPSGRHHAHWLSRPWYER